MRKIPFPSKVVNIRFDACARAALLLFNSFPISFFLNSGKAFTALRISKRPIFCLLLMYPPKYPLMVFIARCAMRHNRRLFNIRIQDFLLQSLSCVTALIGNLYGHCTFVLDRVRCASKAEVPLNHEQRRRPSTAPSIFLRPLVFKSNSSATPLQTTRARYFAGSICLSLVRSTFFGKPRLQH